MNSRIVVMVAVILIAVSLWSCAAMPNENGQQPATATVEGVRDNSGSESNPTMTFKWVGDPAEKPDTDVTGALTLIEKGDLPFYGEYDTCGDVIMAARRHPTVEIVEILPTQVTLVSDSFSGEYIFPDRSCEELLGLNTMSAADASQRDEVEKRYRGYLNAVCARNFEVAASFVSPTVLDKLKESLLPSMREVDRAASLTPPDVASFYSEASKAYFADSDPDAPMSVVQSYIAMMRLTINLQADVMAIFFSACDETSIEKVQVREGGAATVTIRLRLENDTELQDTERMQLEGGVWYYSPEINGLVQTLNQLGEQAKTASGIGSP